MNSGTAGLCPFCGMTVALDMAHDCETYQQIMADKPSRVRDIAPGGLFLTLSGSLVVKSEYLLRPDDPASPAMCIIVGSGEYFHGERLGVSGDDVLAWPIGIHVVQNTWRDKKTAQLRRALQEIITASFAWEEGAPVNGDMQRKRWMRLRNIAMNGLQNAEAEQ